MAGRLLRPASVVEERAGVENAFGGVRRRGYSRFWIQAFGSPKFPGGSGSVGGRSLPRRQFLGDTRHQATEAKPPSCPPRGKVA